MKIFIYGLIGLLCIFLGSCSKEEGEGKVASQEGKQAFDHTESMLGISLSLFDLSLRMNAYMEASRTDIPDPTEEWCFPGYDISHLSETLWVVTSGTDTVFRIETDDLPLTLETAQWKVESRLPSCRGKGVVICTGWGKWQLEWEKLQNGPWEGQVSLDLQYGGEGEPVRLNIPDFVVTGSGESYSRSPADFEKYEKISFEIAEPLRKTHSSPYLFDNGLVYMQLKTLDRDLEKPLKAELKTFAGEERTLQITYQGESTDW